MLTKVRALLEVKWTRKAYFERIASIYPRMDPRYQDIWRAYNSVEEAFWYKLRETGGKYFDEHLLPVGIIQVDYLRIRKHTTLASGLLHDIIEDSELWPIERVKLEFGAEVALLLDYLTKPSKEEYPDEEERLKVYNTRLKYAPREVWECKLPDRLQNLLTMWNSTPEKIARKVEETERYYLPYAEEYGILIHELEAAVEVAIEELKKQELKKGKTS